MACLTLLVYPFHFGAGNGVFHVPIVQQAFDWPQFRNDQFYQSLRGYTSVVWPVLALFGPGAANATVFFALHCVVRVLTFWSLLALLRELDLPRDQRLVAIVVIAGSGLLVGHSRVGDQDLLINYFNHTSVGWPLLFTSLWLMARGKVAGAFAVNGVLFLFNAFFTVWNGFVLALASLVGAFADPRPDRWRRLTRSWAVGLAATLALAAPMLVWIASTSMSARPSFDYATYLRDYWPYHFFIDTADWYDLAVLAVVLALGAASLARWRDRHALLASAFIGYVALFLVGAALPWISHSRALLNLHLLRTDGAIQFLAVIAAACVLSKDLLDRTGLRSGLIAAAGLGGLLIGGKFALVALGAVLAPGVLEATAPSEAQSPGEPTGRLPNRLIVLGVFACAALNAVALRFIPDSISGPDPWEAEWAEETKIAGWLKSHTPSDAVILSRPSARRQPNMKLSELQLLSERRVWVDWKRGAAVMWSPAFYGEWRAHVEEVNALPDVAAAARYACAHDIRYLVEANRDVPAGFRQGRRIYADERYTIIDLAGSCTGARYARAG